jgi:hypothetical protein
LSDLDWNDNLIYLYYNKLKYLNMKTITRTLSGILLLTGIFILISCEKKNTDNPDTGNLEISISLPEDKIVSKSEESTDSSLNTRYYLMISLLDADSNIVVSDSLIPLYVFGTDFISEKVELNTGEYMLTKFMVINQSGVVIFAAPVEGAPLAYLVNKPLPFHFKIFPDQITRIVPEVLAVSDQSPGQFGYANFGMQIISPLHFWAICIIDNPLSTSPGPQVTSAKLTVYAENRWNYTFNLKAGTNYLIIRGGSKIYYFLLEKEGYLPQKMEFTAEQLMKTTQENPLILKIPWDNTVVNLKRGLVAYYPFNGDASDESGNNNNGTVYGAELTSDRKGNANKAFLFDGIDDYIEIEHSASLNLSRQFSISFWAKLETDGPYYFPYHIIEKYPCWGIGQREDDINWGITTGAGSFPTFALTFEFNKFIHLVMIYNGSSLITYCNGEKKASSPANGLLVQNTNKVYISRYNFDGDYYFDGTLDDFRIYNRALTEQEVSVLFNE